MFFLASKSRGKMSCCALGIIDKKQTVPGIFIPGTVVVLRFVA